MAEIIPPGAPAPKSVLGWDGTHFYVLRVDATGHLQVDVLTSALPAGGATAAHQVTQITALQLIDDLRNALQSVATDRLRVRGENQLFTFKGVLAVSVLGYISGAGGYIDSPAVPAGEIWAVTTIVVYDNTTATTRIAINTHHDAANYVIYDVLSAFAIGQRLCWGGDIYMDVGDVVRAYFTGGLVGDYCGVHVTGYRMTAEV